VLNAPRFANFAIGGAEKSGTTSVFNWLTAHPEVSGSSKKETNFFHEGFTGDRIVDSSSYARFFNRCNPVARIYVEASPVYLGEASMVAPRMKHLVPDMKLLFILRDPIERLHSTYNFLRHRLYLTGDLSFDDYIDRCFEYHRRLKSPDELGLEEWALKSLRSGCYAESISVFCSEFSRRQIKVMFFESLRQDAYKFMTQLSPFLSIDAGFWAGFEFHRSNVTFSGRIRELHKLAMRTNVVLEPFMRRHPGLKRTIVRLYKAVNQEREGYDDMLERTRERLMDFYAPSIKSLQRDLDVELPEEWCHHTRGAKAA
jgi:hypothetical protein